jgi:hypothetical protein
MTLISLANTAIPCTDVYAFVLRVSTFILHIGEDDMDQQVKDKPNPSERIETDTRGNKRVLVKRNCPACKTCWADQATGLCIYGGPFG